MTVVRCYADNQFVEFIATLAPLRRRDLDRQLANGSRSTRWNSPMKYPTDRPLADLEDAARRS
jgi:hypothetical protein